MMTVNQCLAHIRANPYRSKAELSRVTGLTSGLISDLFSWIRYSKNASPIKFSRTALESWLLKGWKANEVAAELGVSLGVARLLILEHGFPDQPTPLSRIISRDTLETWLLKGWNPARIGRELGVTFARLRVLMREHGFPDLSAPALKKWRAASGLRCCPRCDQIKTLATEFADRPKSRNGKSNLCIVCLQPKPVVRPPDRLQLANPKEKIEALIQAGRCATQISAELGISGRGLKRLLRDYGLSVPTLAEINRQREANGQRCCSKCKEVKSLETDFWPSRRSRLGKRPECKQCQLIYGKQYRAHVRQAAADPTLKQPKRLVECDSRVCSRCDQRKPLFTCFDPDPNGPRGRTRRCLTCLADVRKSAAFRQSKRELAALGLQLCRACEEVKNLEQDFAVDRRDPVGRRPICRQCDSAGRKPAHVLRPGPAPADF